MTADFPDFETLVAEVRATAPDDRTLARRRAADALRRLAERVVVADVDGGALRELAERLEAMLDDDRLPARSTRYGGVDGPAAVYLLADTHPIGGSGNPIAVRYDTELDGDVLRARIRFGHLHEGTPGVVHGGFVAATFDHLLGGAAIRVGRPVVTGTLTIRYRRPTPVNADLVIECWPGRVVGRKIQAHGRLVTVGGDVTVEAEALFLTVDSARYAPPPAER